MKVVGYCRVVRNENGNLDKQIQLIKNYCEEKNDKLVHIYSDIGSVNIDKRESLKKLLEDSNSDMFDMVVIQDTSRISRELVDFGRILEQLENEDKKLLTLTNDWKQEISAEKTILKKGLKLENVKERLMNMNIKNYNENKEQYRKN